MCLIKHCSCLLVRLFVCLFIVLIVCCLQSNWVRERTSVNEKRERRKGERKSWKDIAPVRRTLSNRNYKTCSVTIVSVELPSNPQDMNPEHLHNLLSMASSPPLPSPLKPVNLSSAATVAVANDSSTPIKSSSNGVPSFAQALLSGEKKKLPLSQPPPTTGTS